LVIRWHKGWFSLFLLGLAYGIRAIALNAQDLE
jgi:hypothetical protein